MQKGAMSNPHPVLEPGVRDDATILRDAEESSLSLGKAENIRWELGDIAIEFVDKDGEHPVSRLTDFCQHTPRHTRDQIRSYMQVARAFHPDTRNPSVPWTIYRDIRNNPDARRRLIQIMESPSPKSKSGGWTASALRRALALKEIRNEIPKEPDQLLQLILESLGKPEVLSSLMGSPAAVRMLGKLLAEHPDLANLIFKAEMDESMSKKSNKIVEEPHRSLPEEIAHLVSELARADGIVSKVLQRASEINLPIDDWQTNDLRVVSKRVSTNADLLHAYLQGVMDLDAALALILKEA